MWDLSSPSNQGSNPHPVQWKCGVLTTGPPGKSPQGILFELNCSQVFVPRTSLKLLLSKSTKNLLNPVVSSQILILFVSSTSFDYFASFWTFLFHLASWLPHSPGPPPTLLAITFLLPLLFHLHLPNL